MNRELCHDMFTTKRGLTSLTLKLNGRGVISTINIIVLVMNKGHDINPPHCLNSVAPPQYVGFLFILVLGQLFVTLLLLINREKIERSLDAAVDQIILQYGGSSSTQDTLMDNVQHYGKCCGRTGPADWLKNFYIHSLNLTRPDVLPCSCFSSFHRSLNSSWCSELLRGRGHNPYNQSCSDTLSVWLQENTLTIVSMDVSLILIQVLQFVVTIYLYRAFGRKASLKRSNQLTDPGHAHLDHAPTELPDYGERNYVYQDSDGGDTDPGDPSP